MSESGHQLGEWNVKLGDIPSWGRLDVRPMGSQNKDKDHFDPFIRPKGK